MELDEGDNELTFWLDEDASKKVTIHVRYEATAAVSAPLTVTEPEDGSQVASSQLTVRGTAPPGADIVRDADQESGAPASERISSTPAHTPPKVVAGASASTTSPRCFRAVGQPLIVG